MSSKATAKKAAKVPVEEMHGDTSWFVRDRFGLFIHWGLYSMPARHEWVRHNENIPTDVYDEKYFKRFDPDLYDPTVWAKAAAHAGMKYVVITTKHHEGFCLWDSRHTDYKATNTPAGRDLLKPMVKAFNEEGLRTGFYYSLIDWRHPHYVLDPHVGPYRSHADREKMNQGRDQQKYADYLHAQVRELLTEYDPSVLWFDFSYPKPDGSGKGRKDWRSEELVALVRKLRPNVILDDRLDLDYGWDIKTPEQFQPRAWPTHKGLKVVWEACQTFSGSWGYHRDEASWRDSDELIRCLIDCVSKGGNLLLNVGPTSRGEFDERALARLRDIGDWMKRHGRSIYGCTEAPADVPQARDCRYTYNPDTNRLYCHVLAWPYKQIYLPGLADRVAYAQLLHDGSEVALRGVEEWQAHRDVKVDDRALALTLPQTRPGVAVPVVELFLK